MGPWRRSRCRSKPRAARPITTSRPGPWSCSASSRVETPPMRIPRIGRAGAALLAAVLLGGGPSGAHAHQYWLSAGDYAPRPGELVEIRACSGVAFRGEAKPWSPDRAVEFSWTGARRTPLARLGVAGDVVWARQAFADSGGAWVTYESNFASIELPAADFDAYLAEEGLDG